jgi:hypothetical protein
MLAAALVSVLLAAPANAEPESERCTRKKETPVANNCDNPLRLTNEIDAALAEHGLAAGPE